MHRIRQAGSAYVAETAIIVGDVTLDENANVWHFCVLRGDVAPIRVGKRVNIQDGSLLHCANNTPLEIADDVAIGHHAVVHCRSVGSRSLIATRATLLDHCEIGEDCIIAAGTLLPPGTIIPDGSVVMGLPGKVVRPMRPDDRDYVQMVLSAYQRLAREHAEGRFPPTFPDKQHP